MIGVVDCGGSNILSVINVLDRLSAKWKFVRISKDFDDCSHIIIPGVSSAGRTIFNFIKNGILEKIIKFKNPMLGICSGMQVFFQHSVEGDIECLNLLKGKVIKIRSKKNIRIPHMGWNKLIFNNKKHKLLNNLSLDNFFVYFTHSYMVDLEDKNIEYAYADHGQKIPALIIKDNLYGTQFHPEKSGDMGCDFINNFINL